MDNANMIQQARQLIAANRRYEARAILEQIVSVDDQNEQAWLWLSAAVESAEDQELCLENVLTINPANQKALKGLEALRARGRSALPPSAPAPAPRQPDYTPPQTGSSVEWGGGSGGGTAHGSGKNVPQPTSAEYDDWMANLPLDGKPPAPASAPAPFGADFDLGQGPFSVGTSSGGSGASPFEGNFDYDSLVSSPASPALEGFPETNTFSGSSSRSSGTYNFAGDDNLFADTVESDPLGAGTYSDTSYNNTPNPSYGAMQTLALDMGLTDQPDIFAAGYGAPDTGNYGDYAPSGADPFAEEGAYTDNQPLFTEPGGIGDTLFPSPEVAPPTKKPRAAANVNLSGRKSFTGAGMGAATLPPDDPLRLIPAEVDALVNAPAAATGNLRTVVAVLVGLNVLSALVLVLNLIGLI